MRKKLINNLSEYREWAWKLSEEHESQHVDKALGLLPEYDCWDYNDKNEPIDENGNVIPEETAETVKLEDWVERGLDFPLIAVYCFDKGWDRAGDYEMALCEFVSLNEFKV